jgi:hypothetical protein
MAIAKAKANFLVSELSGEARSFDRAHGSGASQFPYARPPVRHPDNMLQNAQPLSDEMTIDH